VVSRQVLTILGTVERVRRRSPRFATASPASWCLETNSPPTTRAFQAEPSLKLGFLADRFAVSNVRFPTRPRQRRLLPAFAPKAAGSARAQRRTADRGHRHGLVPGRHWVGMSNSWTALFKEDPLPVTLPKLPVRRQCRHGPMAPARNHVFAPALAAACKTRPAGLLRAFEPAVTSNGPGPGSRSVHSTSHAGFHRRSPGRHDPVSGSLVAPEVPLSRRTETARERSRRTTGDPANAPATAIPNQPDKYTPFTPQQRNGTASAHGGSRCVLFGDCQRVDDRFTERTPLESYMPMTPPNTPRPAQGEPAADPDAGLPVSAWFSGVK